MPFCYHVSYSFNSKSRGDGWGDAQVTWGEPITTFAEIENLRAKLREGIPGTADHLAIIAILPLPDEAVSR